VATIDDVTIREVEKRDGRDCVEICSTVPAVETEQASMVHWGGASMEEVSYRAVIECVQEGGRRGTDLMGETVCAAMAVSEGLRGWAGCRVGWL
jgi:hypothetical protein